MIAAVGGTAGVVAPDWTAGALVTGTPVVADPDPNVTPPAAGRILTPDYVNGGIVARAGQGSFLFDVVGGTSVTVLLWFFDATLNQWVRAGVTAVETTDAMVGAATLNLPTVPGSSWFCQITAVTGAVTSVRYVND